MYEISEINEEYSNKYILSLDEGQTLFLKKTFILLASALLSGFSPE